MARRLRKYIEPKSDQQDPELDVEAQFGRTAVRSAQHAIQKKHRLQCISGWLWCEWPLSVYCTAHTQITTYSTSLFHC